MFKKILIAEDIDSINLGLVSILKEIDNFEIEHTKHCDSALLKFKKAMLDKNPFDLLITDLSFKEDYRNCKIKSGDLLATEILALLPSTKIIIYSIEDRPQKIKSMFENPGIHGYVCKGRESSREIKQALLNLNNGHNYISPDLEHTIKAAPMLEIEEFDVLLLNKLANGNSQEEVSKIFKNEGIIPSSISSIEKRINKLKIYFRAKNTTHLISIVKDMGLL